MNGYSKADIHIHTTFSDGLNEPEAIVNYVVTQTDLSVIAITDHNTIAGASVAQAYWQKHRAEFGHLEIIKGVEISTDVGHIIGLFLEEDIPARMSAEDTVRAIHEQGGLAIAAHPFTHLLPFTDFEGVGRRIRYLDIDGVEERSSVPTELYANWITAVYNQKHQQVARLGSSDAHYLTMVGKTFTWFPGKTAVDFRQAVKNRTVRAGGKINGPSVIWEVVRHLYRRRQLKKLIPNDHEYSHVGNGLKIQTSEHRHHPAVILYCNGELVGNNADVLKTQGENVLKREISRLYIDLNDISFVDSAGLGAILALHKRLQRVGGEVVLCGLNKSVMKTVELLRLDMVISIFPTVDAALGFHNRLALSLPQTTFLGAS